MWSRAAVELESKRHRLSAKQVQRLVLLLEAKEKGPDRNVDKGAYGNGIEVGPWLAQTAGAGAGAGDSVAKIVKVGVRRAGEDLAGALVRTQKEFFREVLSNQYLTCTARDDGDIEVRARKQKTKTTKQKHAQQQQCMRDGTRKSHGHDLSRI